MVQSDQPHVKDQNQTWLDGLQEKGIPETGGSPDGKGFESLELKKEAYDWIEVPMSFSAALKKVKGDLRRSSRKASKIFLRSNLKGNYYGTNRRADFGQSLEMEE